MALDEVAELRALLRRPDRTARQIGVGLIRSWGSRQLDRTVATAVLEAAGGSYPRVPNSMDHPAELLVRLLWDRPRLVGTDDVARVYLIAGERARRAMVHLLALRGDDEGLDALEYLIGPASGEDLLPLPTTPLLDPLEEHPDRDRVTDLLIGLLGRVGWTWHATDLLARTQRCRPGDAAERSRLHRAVCDHVEQLVASCNRAATEDQRNGDPVRSERQRLASLVWLLDELSEQDHRHTLGIMLGSADPRVGAMAASRLLELGEPVAPERLVLIGRDPVARVELCDGLVDATVEDAEPFDRVSLAEGELARWLSEVTELGRPPDEIEFVTSVPHPEVDDAELLVFRFRMRAPHWSCARGWMLGMVGEEAVSCYSAEDDGTLAEHVQAMLDTASDWPDRRADGAA